MIKYIAKDELDSKVRDFILKPSKTLDCYADFSFGDRLMKLPIETKDHLVFESTFCYGCGEEKYLAALSPQIGCMARCNFCELGDMGYKRNLTSEEISDQLRAVLSTAYKRGYNIFSRPLKATFVMGGEPLANPYLPEAISAFGDQIPLQLKISTLFPKNKSVNANYSELVEVVKDYPNIVQFQVSLNSTDQSYRQSLALIPLADFKTIRSAGERWHSIVPNPRKIDLTFTVNKDTPMEPSAIKDILPPDLFAIRLREWTPTQRGLNHKIEKVQAEKMAEIKAKFEDVGYMIIPGSPGNVEWRFKLAAGELLKIYNQMEYRHGT